MKKNISKSVRSDGEKIWFGFGILFLAVLIGLYGIVYALDHRLPTPLELKDEGEYPDAFIAERARNYHKPLVDIGPKVVGSDANEILAVNYIINVLNEIKKQANSAQDIEINLQIVSADWYPRIYANLQNIIVKVHSATNTEHSILINTHFDTVPGSPGGSDDGINVAVALEVLKKISQSAVKPRNNIIFLFNGAEEMGLLASHGFITQHKWRSEVKVLINLEATGAGGREILFQTGPGHPWLLKYYDVPHPHANAGAEEIFQSGIIPSDTDFRIFRAYGDVVGYDFAFARDGYRYHTRFDGYDNIDLGTYQHTGDNILHLVRNLADAPEVANIKENNEKTIFFDCIGLFYIYYSADVGALIINSITIVVSILIIIWTCVSYRIGFKSALVCMPIAFLIHLLGIVIACGLALLVSLILDVANSTMSWYKLPVMIFGLYVAPTILCQLLALMAYQQLEKRALGFSSWHKKLSLCQKVVLQLHINRFLWTIILLIGTIMEIRLAYIIMIPVLFNAIAICLIEILKLHQRHGAIWFSIYVIFSVLPTMKLMYLGHEILALFIPIMGRFGSQMNPEFLVGLLTVLMTIKVTSYFTPLILFIRKPWPILVLISAVFLAAFVLAFTPIGFPYQFSVNDPRPQRHTVAHIQRIFTNQGGDISINAGFYLNKYDRNSPDALENHVMLLQEAYSEGLMLADCEKYVGCGFPGDHASGVWIPVSQRPTFPNALKYDCWKEYESESLSSYHCSIQGSDRLIVYISVRDGSELIYNSLSISSPTYSFVWKNQLTYYFRFISGEKATPLDFTFYIRKNVDVSGAVADLAIMAEYIHEDLNNETEEFKNFLAEFPDWAVIQTELIHYEMIELI